MSRLLTKRRAAGALIAGGLSVAALLGASGAANATTPFYAYGYGSTGSASHQDALNNAQAICNPDNDEFGGYTVLRNPPPYWNGTEYQTDLVVSCSPS